jgi:hypothetical protein
VVDELIRQGRLLRDQIQKHYDPGYEILPPEERITIAELQGWYSGVAAALEQGHGPESPELMLWRKGLERIQKESWEEVGKTRARDGYFVQRQLQESLGLLTQIKLLRLREPVGGEIVFAPPRVLISYAWEDRDHKQWIKDLAVRLRLDGVEIILDQWEVAPGDELASFMERSLGTSDAVLIVCTPSYRLKSTERSGGVGYETSIMTADLANGAPRRKFIPLLRRGDKGTSIPGWLSGSLYLDFRGESDNIEDAYAELVDTLHGRREKPPLVGSPQFPRYRQTPTAHPDPPSSGPEPFVLARSLDQDPTSPELHALALTWLRQHARDDGWSFVWNKLAERNPGNPEILELGRQWLRERA